VRGGGIRDASKRQVERVLKNLRKEWVFAARVKQAYGVVTDPICFKVA
jgi:N-methylhydantoinase B/oxoprolinase/acetone carboxylase alpha subunit